MPRYIDADFALQVYEEAYEITETATWNNPKQAEINKQSHDTVIKLINQTPTADVVEVVRCKDCKYFDDSCGCCSHEDGLNRTCEDFFCSYGKRRTEDDK